jgi:hypothetical protein
MSYKQKRCDEKSYRFCFLDKQGPSVPKGFGMSLYSIFLPILSVISFFFGIILIPPSSKLYQFGQLGIKKIDFTN